MEARLLCLAVSERPPRDGRRDLRAVLRRHEWRCVLSRHLAGERESPSRAGAAEREDRRVFVVLGEDRGLGVVAYVR